MASKFANLKAAAIKQDSLDAHEYQRKTSDAVHVRTTSEQREKIRTNAEKIGMSTSSYIRFVCTLPIKLLENFANVSSEACVLLFDTQTQKKILTSIRKIDSRYSSIHEAYETLLGIDCFQTSEIKNVIDQDQIYLHDITQEMQQLYRIFDDIEFRSVAIIETCRIDEGDQNGNA